jgi:hypothetical protein
MRPRAFRPGFDHTVEAPPGEVACAVTDLVTGSAPALYGNCLERHFQLTVPADQRHFWSPWLHLELEAHRSEAALDPGLARRTYVRGYFTPAPALWTGFLLAHSALWILVFFAGLWGLVQWWYLDQAPWALWIVGLCLLGSLGLLLMARSGQRLAKQQMQDLHGLVSAALQASGPVHTGAGPKLPVQVPD